MGIVNVRVTLYSDPNGDGNPADGQLVEQTVTNSRGQYTFAQLYTYEFYMIGLDAGNFSLGKPLWGTVSWRQGSYSSIYGLLSSCILIPGKAAIQTRTKTDELDPSFGVAQHGDTQKPFCLMVSSKRLQ